MYGGCLLCVFTLFYVVCLRVWLASCFTLWFYCGVLPCVVTVLRCVCYIGMCLLCVRCVFYVSVLLCFTWGWLYFVLFTLVLYVGWLPCVALRRFILFVYFFVCGCVMCWFTLLVFVTWCVCCGLSRCGLLWFVIVFVYGVLYVGVLRGCCYVVVYFVFVYVGLSTSLFYVGVLRCSATLFCLLWLCTLCVCYHVCLLLLLHGSRYSQLVLLLCVTLCFTLVFYCVVLLLDGCTCLCWCFTLVFTLRCYVVFFFLLYVFTVVVTLVFYFDVLCWFVLCCI